MSLDDLGCEQSRLRRGRRWFPISPAELWEGCRGQHYCPSFEDGQALSWWIFILPSSFLIVYYISFLTFPPSLPNVVCFHPLRLTICKRVQKFNFLAFWSCSQVCLYFLLTAPLSNRNWPCLMPSSPQQKDYMCKRHENRAATPRLMLSKKTTSAL